MLLSLCLLPGLLCAGPDDPGTQVQRGSSAPRSATLRCTPPPDWPAPLPIPGGGGALYADLAYWSGTDRTLDVYLPSGWRGSQALPTLVFFHGGGGFSGDKRDPSILEFLTGLVRAGYPVLSVDYTLAPPDCSSGSSPQTVRDARAAIDFVRRAPGNELAGGDVCLPECVVVVGSSDGALRAALIGTLWGAADGGLFDPGIPGGDYRADLCILVSCPGDLYDLGANGACPPPKCHGPPYQVRFPDSRACGGLGGWSPRYPVLSAADWAAAFGSSLPNGCWPPENTLGCSWGSTCSLVVPPPLPTNLLTGNAFADLSPLNWVDGGDAAFYLVHGLCDPVVPISQSDGFYAALVAAGVPVWKDHLASSGHGIRDGGGLLSQDEAVLEVQKAIAQWGGCTQRP